MQPAPPVTIVLLRHGAVAGIARPERFRGRAPLALTDLGLRQAEAAASSVRARYRPTAVYASPLERAVATAGAIASPLGLAVTRDPDLNDIDYGRWQGLTHDEVRAGDAAELLRWESAPHLAQPDGGETLFEVAVRATRFLRALAARHAGENVVVVGHDSVNRIVLAIALDLPFSHYRQIRQAPCAISELGFDGVAFDVRSTNGTEHLRGLL